MTRKLKRSELAEEIRWVFDCPKCGGVSDVFDHPEHSEYVVCDHCDCQVDLED